MSHWLIFFKCILIANSVIRNHNVSTSAPLSFHSFIRANACPPELITVNILKNELVLRHLRCSPANLYVSSSRWAIHVTGLLSFCCNDAWRSKLLMLNDPWGWKHRAAWRSCSVISTCDLRSNLQHFSGFPFLPVGDNFVSLWGQLVRVTVHHTVYKLCIPLGLCEHLQKEKPIMVSWNRSNGSIGRCKTRSKPCIPTYTIIFQHLRLQAVYCLCVCVCVCVHVCVSALPHGCV